MRWTLAIVAAAVCSTSAAAPALKSTIVALRVGVRGLQFYEVTQTELKLVAHVDDSVYMFGWLDRHTVITVGDSIVQRIVDGKVVDRFTLFDSGDYVLITRAGEAWIGTCYPSASMCDRDNHYTRVWPLPRIKRTEMPPDVIEDRSPLGILGVPAQPFPVARQPGSATLSRAPVPVRNGQQGSDEPPFEISGVACQSGSTRTTYPAANETVGNRTFRVVAVRWVSEEPPLYEITTSISDGEAYARSRVYLRACREAPLMNLAWLGGTLWAEIADYPTGLAPATWTIWNGATKLGTLEGGALRRSPL